MNPSQLKIGVSHSWFCTLASTAVAILITPCVNRRYLITSSVDASTKRLRTRGTALHLLGVSGLFGHNFWHNQVLFEKEHTIAWEKEGPMPNETVIHI